MKNKPDVLQGTLALMVLKTLDVLGPLHGYGIARRIEQISGDLLNVNQGTSISGPAEAGAGRFGRVRLGRFRKQSQSALLPADARRTQATAGRDAELGTDGGDHCAILRGESGRSRMKTLRRFFKRLSSWATARKDEERLRAEIEAHIALQTDENIRAGLSAEEARREAVWKFGPVEAVKESYREQRGLPFMETLIQDTRYALRRLRMAPAFTIATVLTLALGIGATTSIFTLVHAVLLKSLPVANPSELVRLGKEARCCFWSAYDQDKEYSLASYDLYKYFRDNTREFAGLAAFSAQHLTSWASGGRAARSRPKAIRANSFPEITSRRFGIHAYAGRVLTAADDRPGAAGGRGDELSVVAAEIRIGSVGHRRRVHDRQQAIYHRGDRAAWILWRHFAQQSARFFYTAEHVAGGRHSARSRPGMAGSDWAHEAAARARIDRSRNARGTETMAPFALGRHERERAGEPSGSNPVSKPRRRRHHQHARTIRALAPHPDDGHRIRAADRLRQRRQSHAGSRHGAAAADVVEYRPGRANCAGGEAAAHREYPAVAVRRSGGAGDRICGHEPDLAIRVPVAARHGRNTD